MSAFESELLARLAALERQNLFRKLRAVSSPQQPQINIEGRELLNFSSNDYLGLATHPKLKAAAIEATEKFGTGSGASRLISGSLQPHRELEEALAAFKRTEAALVFSSGYATALGTIPALAGKDDVIVIDKLVHASIIDAARLSGATLRIFRHNDVEDLEKKVRWASAQAKAQTLIITETIFSMDGDIAPLKEIVAIKERYGAWLMVDEAHATGLTGASLRGVAEELGVADQIEIQMGTLGKALGSAGGYIAGSSTLVNYLINTARSFIFSTAPPPGASAAARAALRIVDSPEGWTLVQMLRANIAALWGRNLAETPPDSPILRLMVGDEKNALQLSARLVERGIFAPAIRYPTVPRGEARLRFSISAAHRLDEIQFASNELESLRASGMIPS